MTEEGVKQQQEVKPPQEVRQQQNEIKAKVIQQHMVKKDPTYDLLAAVCEDRMTLATARIELRNYLAGLSSGEKELWKSNARDKARKLSMVGEGIAQEIVVLSNATL